MSFTSTNSDNMSHTTSVTGYDLLILGTSIASLTSLVLIMFSYFDAPLVIALTIAISAILLRLFGSKIQIGKFYPTLPVLLILISAWLPRSDFYLHLMGGQDQGLYVNMANNLLQGKGLNFIDPFRSELTGEDRTIYDRVPMSSIPLIDKDQSIFTIEFYPLHPAWMAISKWFFGNNLQPLSLLFFSALGIIGAYHLALLVFSTRRAALISALFVAINPALVFFSKFPVTEIVAFAFSINGLLFLLRSINSKNSSQQWLYWLIGLLSFNCFFYTRMQFFIFIPFFSLIFSASLLDESLTKKSRLLITTFIIALGATFIVSLLYYFYFQNGLYAGIILGHISSLLNTKIVFSIGAVALLFGTIIFSKKVSPIRSPINLNEVTQAVFKNILVMRWVLPLALLASTPSAIHFYNTGQMPPFSFTIPLGEDPLLIRYHVIYRLGLMLSPIGLVFIFIAPFLQRFWTKPALTLSLLIATIWLIILLQPWAPYLYYYSRYLVSEMIPYSLIFLAGGIDYLLRTRKNIGKLIFIGMLFYFAYFTSVQYGKPEAEDPSFLKEITAIVSPKDVLLTSGLDDRQHVPLRVTFGLRVYPLTDQHGAPIPISSESFARLANIARNRGGRLLLLTSKTISSLVPGYLGNFEFKNSFLTNGEHVRENVIFSPNKLSRLILPTSYETRATKFTLYKVNPNQMEDLIKNKCSSEMILGEGEAMHATQLEGFSIPEPHGRWTDGDTASFKCKLPDEGMLPHKIIVEFLAFTPHNHEQIILFSANGNEEIRMAINSNDRQQLLEIPLAGLAHNQEIQLRIRLLSAKSPKELGLSEDSRKLGISIKRIRFE